MSKPEKKIRVATNRIDEKNVESIEQSSNGCLFWTTEEENQILNADTNVLVGVQNLGASIPVDLAFVEEFFAKQGRVLDPSLLKYTPINHPYAHFMA